MRDYHRGLATGIGLANLVTALFLAIALRWTFTLTPPSDPLEYVGPAIIPLGGPALDFPGPIAAPEGGFPYLDRVLLWLWLRIFAALPLAPEHIGPIATLTQTCLIVWLGTFWLSRRVSTLAGGLFGALYMLCPVVMGIATYTYPTQLMTLVLLVVGILNARDTPKAVTSFWSGFGMALALLSKVQAGGVGLILTAKAILDGNGRLLRLALLAAGGIVGLAAIAVLIAVLDGPEQPARIVTAFFFGGAAERQFAGIADRTFPSFHQYLFEPTVVLAILGTALCWYVPEARPARIFALFAIGQTAFLIAIYIVTQRGGALITNYSSDAVTFGLLAFAAAIGGLLGHRLPPWASFVIVLLSTALVAGLAQIENIAVPYAPAPLPPWLAGRGLDWLDVMAIPTFAVALYWIYRCLRAPGSPRPDRLLASVIGVVLALAALNAGKGPAYGAYHRDWSSPYHDLAHRILDESEIVCLDATLGNPSPELAYWRMDWLLSTLYGHPHAFRAAGDPACTIIYSDALERYGANLEPPAADLRASQFPIVRVLDQDVSAIFVLDGNN